MKYMLMIYEAEDIWADKTEEERQRTLAGHGKFSETLTADGVEFSGARLMPTATSTSLRRRNGKRQVIDGPFAETKEHLAGFYIVDCESLDDAIRYAELIPNCATGTVEIRPLGGH